MSNNELRKTLIAMRAEIDTMLAHIDNIPTSHVVHVEPKWYTIQDFATLLGVCSRTVSTWMKAGMPHMRLDGVVRIKADAAEEWLRLRSKAS